MQDCKFLTFLELSIYLIAYLLPYAMFMWAFFDTN